MTPATDSHGAMNAIASNIVASDISTVTNVDPQPDDTNIYASNSPVVRAAREFYNLAASAIDDQRKREREDLRFQIPDVEHQWDRDAILNRSAQLVAGQSVPPRPMLVVDTLTEPIELQLNSFRSAHLGVEIHPLTEDATDETAEVLQGLYRHIEVCSKAHLARTWAYDRGIKCGTGWWKIRTEYDPESSVPGDQRIVIDRVLYQESGFFDPWAQQPDWSDADEFLEVEPWPLERYKREYPKSQLASFSDDDYSKISEQLPRWFNNSNKGRVITIAVYHWVTHDEEKIEVTDRTGDTKKISRIKRVLHRAKVNGVEELEPEQIIPGSYIPAVPYIGRELQPVDGERHFIGMIRPARDGAKLTNYAASSAVELAALEPKAPWLIEEGTDEGYKPEWQHANTHSLNLHWKRVGLSGLPAMGPPQRVQIDNSRLGVSMTLLGMGRDFVQTSTATFDPSLGKQPTAHRSGRALLALQDRSVEATSGFMANMADVSMMQEATIVLDLIPHYYDRPGRIATILDENYQPKRVMLNRPYDSSTMQPLPFGTDAEKAQSLQQVQDPNHPAKFYDLNKGRYGVTVTVGKSSRSRLEAGQSAMGELMQRADPQMQILFGPEFFRFQDFPGAKNLETLTRKFREHQFPFLRDDANVDAAQQAHQAMAENQQLKQQLTEAMQAIQTKQVEKQADYAKAQMQEEFAMAKARLDAETKIAVAEINKRADVFREERERIGLQLDAARTVAHESQQNALDRAHESVQNSHGRAPEAALSAMEHAQTLEQQANAPQPTNTDTSE